MQDLIKTTGIENLVNTENARSGATTVRTMRAKEFKDKYKESHPDANNREVKTQFEAYARRESLKLGAAFDFQKAIALNAAGKLGIERVTSNKGGDKATIVFVDLGQTRVEEMQSKVDDLNAEEIKKTLEYMQSKLAAIEQPKQ